ncbi:MAG: hypothetical protein ACP5OR_07240 [Candidatus Dormibacteria bacterium]
MLHDRDVEQSSHPARVPAWKVPFVPPYREPVLFVVGLLLLLAIIEFIIAPLFTSNSLPASAQISGTVPSSLTAGNGYQLSLDYENLGEVGISPICLGVSAGPELSVSNIVIGNSEPATIHNSVICGGYLGASEPVNFRFTITFATPGNYVLTLTPLGGTKVVGPIRHEHVTVH